ncbi:homeobox protein Mohawk-like [Boleophthalmus pectinirostris]|uniref:homeobox protein Mohawk-like n=1 Tax=Boleophthalmus pectinirostris TaxID=150288 RepID=UPI00242A8FD5|nr:homeobox protein Mohawk-like [Boleophthalmus pectinirostris]
MMPLKTPLPSSKNKNSAAPTSNITLKNDVYCVNSADVRCQEATSNGSPKYRKYGSRLGGVKVRHKRQVLQDMARPLKHWLYKHRDNPYPTKTEKVLLALGSHMTLVQVSNWFANARRRLKNTVRQPDLSWALRIKLYNQYIQGNAERLSVCSDDTDTDTDECPLQAQIRPSDFGRMSSHQSTLQSQSRVLSSGDDGVSGPSKYKSSLLNRYLNDTLRHMMGAERVAGTGRKRRSHSESFSSNDCERDVASPASSYSTEANYVYHMDPVDYTSTKSGSEPQHGGDPGWRELHAAVALTSLAQGQSSGVSREPLAVCRTPPLDRPCAKPHPSCPALTSRIIQKSSHIAEVQTVRVALANCV